MPIGNEPFYLSRHSNILSLSFPADKAQLCLFGSSKNGFGFRDSDLDICMTLEGHETAEALNCKEIIEGLAKVLKKHTGLRNILPITTAKVPIVKFEHRQSGLEGDISLYNTLAQHNTRMLATYAAIDPRVQYLGYTMKCFEPHFSKDSQPVAGQEGASQLDIDRGK